MMNQPIQLFCFFLFVASAHAYFCIIRMLVKKKKKEKGKNGGCTPTVTLY
jgi:hypothetical protein